MNNHHQTYVKEIDQEYKKLRQRITPNGQTIPYNQYIRARVDYFIEELATPADLLRIKANVALQLDKLQNPEQRP